MNRLAPVKEEERMDVDTVGGEDAKKDGKGGTADDK